MIPGNSQEVFEALTYLTDKVYFGRDKAIRDHEDLVNQRINCNQPDGEPVHIPPDALKEINKAKNQVYSKFHSYEFSPDQTERENNLTQKYTKLFDYLILQNDILNEGSIGRELASDLVMGFGSLKGPFPTFNEECPVFFQVADPLSVYPDPSGQFVIESYKRMVCDVYEEMRKLNESRGKEVYNTSWYKTEGFRDNYQEIDWIAFWSASKRMFAIRSGGTQVPLMNEMQDNVLGFIPFSYSYSGWGKGKYRGKPEDRCVGRLKGMESGISARARSMTALNIYLRYNVYGRYLIPKEHETFFQPAYWAKHPGSAMSIPKEAMPNADGGMGMQIMPMAQINPALFTYMALAQNEIEGIGGPDDVSGNGAADASGKAQMYRIRQAGLDYEAPREGLERVYSDLFCKTIKLFSNKVVFKEAIEFGKERLSPSDVIDGMTCKFKLLFRDPLEDRDKLEMGVRLTGAGLILEEEFRKEYMNDPDWANWTEKKLADIAIKTIPAIAESVAQEGLMLSGKGNLVPQVQTDGRTSSGTGAKELQGPIRTNRVQEGSGAGSSPVPVRNLPGMGGTNGP